MLRLLTNTRQMEVQMKAICEGRSTRNDVVQQNLEQYRAVFNRTSQQISVLKAVSRSYAKIRVEAPTNIILRVQAITKYVLQANQG